MFHDLIIKSPDFKEGVRFDFCTDQEIKEWIRYALIKGATAFETMPSEVTL